MIVKRIATAAGAAALAVVLHGQASAAEITLKLGTVANTTVSMGQAIVEVLMPKLKEYSKGRMEIVPHWAGSICGEQKCGEQAMQGLIDIATSSTANFGNFGPTYAITDLPFIFKDGPSANKLADTVTKRPESADRKHAIDPEGHQNSRYQKPGRIYVDQVVGRRTHSLRLDAALPRPANRRCEWSVRPAALAGPQQIVRSHEALHRHGWCLGCQRHLHA